MYVCNQLNLFRQFIVTVLIVTVRNAFGFNLLFDRDVILLLTRSDSIFNHVFPHYFDEFNFDELTI